MESGAAGQPLPALDADLDEDRIEFDHTGAASSPFEAANGRRFQSTIEAALAEQQRPTRAAIECRGCPAFSLTLLLFLVPGGRLRKLACASSKAESILYTIAD